MRKLRKLFLLAVVFITASLSEQILAQNLSVSGCVTDANSGETVLGATVMVKGTTNYAATDLDGKYELSNVASDATLVYSLIGYTDKEVAVNGRGVIDVTLDEETQLLDEILVVGYGTTTKRKLVGSVSNIGSEKFENSTYPNLQTALQGKVPGLIIQASGGGVNDTPSISIRGGGTPLVVIDGIVASMDEFSMLNPEDIETMSVLKDASATAVYGSKAGNGIILVKTKSGKEGRAPRVRYSNNFQFGSPTVVPDRLDSYEFMDMSNDVYMRATGSPLFTEEQRAQIGNSSQYPNNNWTDLFYKDFSFQQKHNVSVDGGNDKTTYFVSLGQLNNNGILPDNVMKLSNTNFRSNVNTKFEKIGLTLNTGLSANIKNTTEPYEVRWQEALQTATPLVAGYNSDGTLANDDFNPLRDITKDAGYKNKRTKYLNAQASLTWEPTFVEGLTIGGMANYRDYDYLNREWNCVPDVYNWDDATQTSSLAERVTYPSLLVKSGYNRSVDLETRVGYVNTFGKHTIDGLLLYTQRSGFSDYVQATKQGYTSTSIDQLIVGPNDGQTNTGSSAEYASAGVVARIKYDYDSKYILELSGRYDGNDNFAPGYKWGFFPAVSGVWMMSDEPFMKSLKDANILNLFKIRASYGEVGLSDGVSRFEYLSSYNKENWKPDYYTVGGDVLIGYKEGALVDPSSLSWYTSKSSNIGFDFTSLNNKLEGSVDYFFYKTTGFLCSDATRYSETLGTKLPTTISNTEHRRAGYEVALRYKDGFGDWNYNIGFNFSYYNQLYNILDTENLATLKNPYTRQTQQTDYYGICLVSDGLYQSMSDILNAARRSEATYLQPGDIKYSDVNGDGKIDSNDERRMDEPATPHFVYGVDFSISWRDLSLSGLVQGIGNQVTQYGQRVRLGSAASTLYDFQTDSWSPNNTDARYPLIHTSRASNGGNNEIFSDYYFENVKYIRLKSLDLSYNIKNSCMKNVDWIGGFNITLSGTNLLTFSDVLEFMDPEAVQNDTKSIGEDWAISGGGFPIMRTFSAGISIQF